MFGRLPSLFCSKCYSLEYSTIYKSIFCGLGKELHNSYGLLLKSLVNRDSSFVCLFGISQSLNNEKPISQSCCIPFINKPIYTSNKHIKYSAAVTICGLYNKLNDDINDSNNILYKKGLNISKYLLLDKYKNALDILKEYNFPISNVINHLSQQSNRESNFKYNPSLYSLSYLSESTSYSYGEILRYTSLLDNTKDNINNSLLTFIIGKELGHIIYLIDSIQDYDKDYKNNEFNPLLCLSSYLSNKNHFNELIKEYIQPEIYSSYNHIQELLKQMKFTKNEELIKLILGEIFLSKLEKDIKNEKQEEQENSKSQKHKKSHPCDKECCDSCKDCIIMEAFCCTAESFGCIK